MSESRRHSKVRKEWQHLRMNLIEERRREVLEATVQDALQTGRYSL